MSGKTAATHLKVGPDLVCHRTRTHPDETVMRLISALQIDSFRSVRSLNLQGLADLAVFAGLNNSGKSNVLRALNAFFNGVTDEGQYVDVDADYYRPDLSKKKAKKISIAVTFSLPPQFKFRSGLEPVRDLLGGAEFTLRKTWTRKEFLPHYLLNDRLLPLEEQRRVDQFLQLVSFRYIPNRVLPVEVVRREHQSLRDVLVRRLGKRQKEHEKTFTAIQEASRTLISSLVHRLQEASPDIGDIRLATPASWADMAFAFGYRLGTEGIEIEDSSQGAGIQGLLMLETLYLIDRDFFQKFGWRQAAIWAIEEPESSLHASLEARVAAYLRSIATDAASRLQVLGTTHSDLMVQYANQTVIVERKGWETVCTPMNDPRAALERLARLGTSRWQHPLLHLPLQPLLLVEGKHDAIFLEEALRLLRPRLVPQVVYLGQLEGTDMTGGADNLVKYVRFHKGEIKARQPGASVAVVLDWDSAGKRQPLENLFAPTDPFVVDVWPVDQANPRLTKTFRGVERFFSDRMIQEAENRGAPVYHRRGGKLAVIADEYHQVKDLLLEIVREGLDLADLAHSRPFLEGLFTRIGAL